MEYDLTESNLERIANRSDSPYIPKDLSLDEFIGEPHFPDRLPQIISNPISNISLPDKCSRCGTKTKRAGKIKRKKTRDTISRVICTNKQCRQSYKNKEDKIPIIGTVFDKLAIGFSSRQIRDALVREHSCNYSHSVITKWMEKYLRTIRILTDDIACLHKFGNSWGVDETYVKLSKGQCWITAVLDEDSRFIIDYIITENRPNNVILKNLFKNAQTIAGTPKVITTDLYLAYPNAIKKAFGDNVEHRNIRSKTKKEIDSSIGPDHNNHIERVWKTMKKDALRNSSEWSDGITHLVYLFVLHYNYIRIHSNFDTTPAMAAGYVKPFADFQELIRDASSHEKAFLLKIEKYMKHVTIRTPEHCKAIIILPKASLDHKATRMLNRILEEHGFGISKNKRGWIRKTPSLYQLACRNSDRGLPERSFDVCSQCYKIAISTQEIHKQHGFRNADGVKRTQPRCSICRPIKSDKHKIKVQQLNSIMPIDRIAKSGQSILTAFPHERKRTKSHHTRIMTKVMLDNKKSVQLILDEPPILLNRPLGS